MAAIRRSPQRGLGNARIETGDHCRMTSPFLIVQLSDFHVGAEWADGDPVGTAGSLLSSARRLPCRRRGHARLGRVLPRACDAAAAAEGLDRARCAVGRDLPQPHDVAGAVVLPSSGPSRRPATASLPSSAASPAIRRACSGAAVPRVHRAVGPGPGHHRATHGLRPTRSRSAAISSPSAPRPAAGAGGRLIRARSWSARCTRSVGAKASLRCAPDPR